MTVFAISTPNYINTPTEQKGTYEGLGRPRTWKAAHLEGRAGQGCARGRTLPLRKAEKLVGDRLNLAPMLRSTATVAALVAVLVVLAAHAMPSAAAASMAPVPSPLLALARAAWDKFAAVCVRPIRTLFGPLRGPRLLTRIWQEPGAALGAVVLALRRLIGAGILPTGLVVVYIVAMMWWFTPLSLFVVYLFTMTMILVGAVQASPSLASTLNRVRRMAQRWVSRLRRQQARRLPWSVPDRPRS